ncbi:MAG: polyribonucleotide nucleotidyltransferase [Deltaproteobacteria bacterium]|nr:polyribonucleotide nucleotidyltransferase [Deltaproteobacteria bacterium]
MSKLFSTDFAGRSISLKTDYVAGQADGAVLATYGDTVVLVTAVSLKTIREGVDFLPLTVDYQEMTFAAGKIPGGFFKREGRLNEKEILTSRIIDRSIRPLFPKNYFHETQLMASVLSGDNENVSDVAAMLAASAALEISDIPFKGPIAGVRIGRVEEGGAAEVAEEVIVDAIDFGLEQMRPVIELQDRMRAEAGKAKRAVVIPTIDAALVAKVTEAALPGLKEGYGMARKMERYAKLDEVRKSAVQKLTAENPSLKGKILEIIESLERRILREMILKENRRIDGRSNTEIRPISSEVGLLPRAHGSALFNRGETQALVTVTLGTSHDEQRMDYIAGEERRSFLLHYNFPPFSVGEAKPLRSPGRREIGHGGLSRRALIPVLPSKEVFPYTIRVVSDILSSNGSSSMATVCGGCLSLMDAGVPIRDTVAGIAMGLLKEGDQVVILSDILGDEDHAGDMDFKVCGTEKGVTSLQMDIKIDNLTGDILRKALSQAREGRVFIIGKLRETLAAPRPDISVYAPRITTVKVRPEKVRDVIGSGGKNIRQIVAETGVEINVEDDGTVTIASSDAEAAARAVAMVKWLTEDAEVGKIYNGTVKKIVDFGAFVEILPGTEGLLHISQLAKERVNKVTDILQEGDEVRVKVLEVDKQGKIRLSRKEALGENGQ